MTFTPLAGVDFRGLVSWVLRRGKPSHVRQRTTAWAATAAGISKQHLFNLMSGKRHASSVCVAKIAKGWNLDFAVVDDALVRTRGGDAL